MISKAQNLAKAYKEHNQHVDKANSVVDEIDRLNEELSSLNSQLLLYDYNNPKIVEDYIEKSVSSEARATENKTDNALERQLNRFRKDDEKIRRIYMRLSSWYLSKKSADKLVRNAKPYIYSNEDDISISNHSIVLSGTIGWLIIGLAIFILFGPVYFIFKLAKFLADAFLDLPILDTLIALVVSLMSLSLWWSFLPTAYTFLLNRGFPVIPIGISLLVLSVVFFVVEIVLSHSALETDADKFLAVYYPDLYLEKGHNSVMADFEKKIDSWRLSVDKYKSGERTEFVDWYVDKLRAENEKISLKINSISKLIAVKESELQEEKRVIDELDVSIDKHRESVREPILDVDYNQSVLTEYVCFKDSNYETFMHSVEPFVYIYHSGDSADIQTEIAHFISDFYSGLICDNCFGIISYTFMDFETGGTLINYYEGARMLLEQRLINIIHTDNGRDNLYSQLRNQKSRIIGAGGAGNINTENPERLRDGDPPFKYNIVLHYGQASLNISGDLLQLYRNPGMFGFLPVFIMSEEEHKQVVNGNSSLSSTINEFPLLQNDYK